MENDEPAPKSKVQDTVEKATGVVKPPSQQAAQEGYSIEDSMPGGIRIEDDVSKLPVPQPGAPKRATPPARNKGSL